MHSERRGLAILTATAVSVAGVGVATMNASAAAVGCRVDYAVGSQWAGGFGANVTVTNLGDAVSAWTLTWSFTAGQTITQAWNAMVSQTGGQVTARNVSYNGALDTGASTSFGFNGAFNGGTNAAPASFALNGTTCTGTAVPTVSSTPASISPTVSTPPTTAPASSAPATVSPQPSGTRPPGRPSQCTGTSPVVCHFAVSPGNYTVTAWVGDTASAGNTSMSVEARRRILPATATPAGTVNRYVFTVNVRQPEGQPTGQGGTGTAGLDVTFGGTAPRVSGLTVAPVSNPFLVYLAGDSTVCDQPAAPYTGWGQILPTYVGAGAVVANYGDSGESSGSFLSNGSLFPTMRPLIKQSDLVLIQFGHNDKTTTAAQFRSNLTSMISQVRARGGVPVLVTPPVRRLFSGTRLTDTALHINGVGANLPAEMRSLGAAQNVPVIDLTAKSRTLIESLGASASARLFLTTATDGVADNTHFSEYGAGQMADLVVQGIREQNLPLAGFLR